MGVGGCHTQVVLSLVQGSRAIPGPAWSSFIPRRPDRGTKHASHWGRVSKGQAKGNAGM